MRGRSVPKRLDSHSGGPESRTRNWRQIKVRYYDGSDMIEPDLMTESDWQARLHSEMPRMAWLARCSASGNFVDHGADVEVRRNGFFEGAWSGRFDDWDFASTGTVAGSGAVNTPDGVLFVTPSHTLEGIYYHQGARGLTASNSIVLILKFLGSLDQHDPHFGSRMASIVRGSRTFFRHVATTEQGPVYRAVAHNLHFSSTNEISERPKPNGYSFADFGEYRAALSREISLLFENAASPQRERTYRPLSTCSSGYDSTACLVLARELGCRNSVTLRMGEGKSDDSGEHIAQKLGVRVSVFERRHPCGAETRLNEFIASGMGGEDVAYSAFQDEVAGSVLLTGFHGDKIWSKHASPSDCLERGDVSGASLGEFRLRCGFVHLPVPFIAGVHHGRIAEISNAPEMAPYSIGGWYDRPIPRRIAEDAGIERSAFGTVKMAASITFFARKDLQPPELRIAVEDQVAYLAAMARLRYRIREGLFPLRLAIARLLQRAVASRLRLRWVALPLRDAIAGDPRMFEHDSPDAYFQFRAAFAEVQGRYPHIPCSRGDALAP